MSTPTLIKPILSNSLRALRPAPPYACLSGVKYTSFCCQETEVHYLQYNMYLCYVVVLGASDFRYHITPGRRPAQAHHRLDTVRIREDAVTTFQHSPSLEFVRHCTGKYAWGQVSLDCRKHLIRNAYSDFGQRCRFRQHGQWRSIPSVRQHYARHASAALTHLLVLSFLLPAGDPSALGHKLRNILGLRRALT